MLAPASARAHDGLDDVDLDPWADADGPVVELAPELASANASTNDPPDTRPPASTSASASASGSGSGSPSASASASASASTSTSGGAKPRPFRTAPLTSLPRSLRPDPASRPNPHPDSDSDPARPGKAHARNDPLLDSGPRRRSAASTPRDSPEPYSAASGSAYAPDALPSRSTSHPLALDSATAPAPKLTPPRLGRLRSASHVERLSSPLSPLASPSISALSPSPSTRPASHSLTSSPAPTRPSSSLTHPHPLPHPALAGLGGLGGAALSDLRDVTRPGLARVTSETERAASVGSWSAASSDLADHDPDEEVDVVVHTVASGESMAGIALRYGIELAALRRANKLWPSDSLHLRTQLFVPLDACRASRDAWIVRDEGGATLVRRRAAASEGRRSGEADDSATASPRTLNGNTPLSSPGTERGDPADALDTISTSPTANRTSSISTSPTATRTSNLNGNSNGAAGLEHIPLQVARVPASQLRFFPQQRRGGRSSMDSDASLGRNADSVRALASRSGGSGGGSRSGRGLFAALALDDEEEYEYDEYGPRRPHRVTVRSGQYAPGAAATPSSASAAGSSTASPPASVSGGPAGSGSAPTSSLTKSPTKKRNVVRLRPPSAQPPPVPGSGFAARISNFFTVPPPPSHLPPPTRLAPALAPGSVDSSRRNSGADEVRRERDLPPELVEMDSKPPSAPAPRKTDKKRD